MSRLLSCANIKSEIFLLLVSVGNGDRGTGATRVRVGWVPFANDNCQGCIRIVCDTKRLDTKKISRHTRTAQGLLGKNRVPREKSTTGDRVSWKWYFCNREGGKKRMRGDGGFRGGW